MIKSIEREPRSDLEGPMPGAALPAMPGLRRVHHVFAGRSAQQIVTTTRDGSTSSLAASFSTIASGYVSDSLAPSMPSAGDVLPSDCELIEVRVSELKQLFNAIDPSPFRERDLDHNAEEFIVAWAMEASPSATLALAVYLERPAGPPTESVELREAIHEFFRHRAELSRRRLRELFRRGRTSLVIGLSVLGVSFAAGNLVGELFSNHVAGILREGLLIGGWVAVWRPMEIFLYDWWPIRSEASLADRLSVMPVRISYRPDGSTDSWRWDWPVAASATRAVHSEPIESLKAPSL